jgi:hypothetical protein
MSHYGYGSGNYQEYEKYLGGIEVSGNCIINGSNCD